MGYGFKKVVWSPVELEYLKKNKDSSVNQLTVALAKSQNAIKKKLSELKQTPNSLSLSGIQKTSAQQIIRRSKIGRRKDCNNLFFRSGWEANVYRLLKQDSNIKLIEYEPRTFSFTEFGILHGTVSYTPDFRITFQDETYIWIEVKGGLLKQADKTKIRRFKKHFGEEFNRLQAITPGIKSKTFEFFQNQGVKIRWCYPDLNKQYKKLIPNWE